MFSIRLKGGEIICIGCLKKLNRAYPDLGFQLRKYTLADAQIALEDLSHGKIQKKDIKVVEIEKVKTDTVSEFKRTCNECGKVWHVLESREKKLQQDIKRNNCNELTAYCGMCGGHYDALSAEAQTMRNDQSLTEEIGRLKQCPNCKSGNYNETSIVYNKR